MNARVIPLRPRGPIGVVRLAGAPSVADISSPGELDAIASKARSLVLFRDGSRASRTATTMLEALAASEALPAGIVDVDRVPALAQASGVRTTPTWIAYGGGVEIGRLVGEWPSGDLRGLLSGADVERDIPPPHPDRSAAENERLRSEVETLVYGPENREGYQHDQPPRNASHAEVLFARGTSAAANEAAFYPARVSLTAPSVAASKAFDELNRGWRRLEAWGGERLGAEIGNGGPFPKNSIAPTYRAWLAFSRGWKTGERQDTTALEAHALDLQKAEKVASEHGYPGVYHADRREAADGTGYGASHYVHAPDVADQTAAFGAAGWVDRNLPNPIRDGVPGLRIPSWGDVPRWAKVAGGVALAAVVVGPIVAARLGGR